MSGGGSLYKTKRQYSQRQQPLPPACIPHWNKTLSDEKKTSASWLLLRSLLGVQQEEQQQQEGEEEEQEQMLLLFIHRSLLCYVMLSLDLMVHSIEIDFKAGGNGCT